MNPLDSQAHQGSIFRGALWLLLGFGLALGIYESLPLLARKVPWKFEKRVFENLPLNQTKECTPSSQVSTTLQRLVQRIYPIYPGDRDFSVHISVIQGKEVNAFAFLAGRIFVYDGLMQHAESADELAAILAHEIEHIKQRHIIHGLIQQILIYSAGRLALPNSDVGTITGLFNAAARLKFSRSQEEEADQGAVERLRDTHVSVQGFKNFFNKRAKSPHLLSIFSDHPSDEARSHMADAFMGYPTKAILSESEWKALKGTCSVEYEQQK